MSRTGTRKTNIRKRRARVSKNQKFARLKRLSKRFGIVLGLIVFTLWVGSWLWFGGFVQRGADWTQEQFYLASADAGFAVDEILLEGRINSDADVLRALINIERGDPVFQFNPKEAKKLIERVSWVKEAHVERKLPDTIYIGIMERKPMALWQHKGKISLIDWEGVVLTDRNLEPFKHMVIAAGVGVREDAPELFSMLKIEPLVYDRLEAVNRVAGRRWDLRLKNGIKVKLPEEDIGLALRQLVDLQERDQLMDKDLLVIDMREAERITVRTRPGAVREYKASFKGGSPI